MKIVCVISQRFFAWVKNLLTHADTVHFATIVFPILKHIFYEYNYIRTLLFFGQSVIVFNENKHQQLTKVIERKIK